MGWQYFEWPNYFSLAPHATLHLSWFFGSDGKDHGIFQTGVEPKTPGSNFVISNQFEGMSNDGGIHYGCDVTNTSDYPAIFKIRNGGGS